MNRQRVESSNLASVSYDVMTRTLEVEFLNGSIYHYFHVPGSLYSGLMQASSHGTYLDQHIKKGGFNYRRIS